jgi:HEAT repeat protein
MSDRQGHPEPRPRSPFCAALLALALASAASAQTVRFEDVVSDLKASDARVRRGAMRTLLDAGYVEAASPIAALTADPLEDIRLEAIAAEVRLLSSRRLPRSRYVAGFVEVRDASVAEAAFRQGATLGARPAPPDVSRALIRAMRDPSAAVRTEAAFAFGALSAPDADMLASADLQAAFDAVAAGLAAADARERLAAARVAGRLIGECGRGCLPADPNPVGNAFINAMNDGDERVRNEAMGVLGLMRYERAIGALADRFAYHERGPAAEAALEALARIAHPSSAPLFWSLLTHKDAGVRRHAVEGIARIGNASRAGELETALAGDRSDQVSLALTFALQRLGRGPRLERLVEGAGRPATRQQAREYLIELGPANVQPLTAYLQDPTPDLRLVIVDVLGRIGSRSTAASLAPFTKDPDPRVASAAERAVARLSRK